MTHFVSYIAIGATAVGLLILWMLRSRRIVTRSEDPVNELIEAFQHRPEEFADRIFDADDWSFISNALRREDRTEFLRDRTKLGLLWLQDIRGRAAHVMRLYREAARSSRSLTIAWEVRLAINYGLFLAIWTIMYLVVRVFGPFHVRAIINGLLSASSRLRLNSDALSAIFIGSQSDGSLKHE